MGTKVKPANNLVKQFLANKVRISLTEANKKKKVKEKK